MRRSLSMLLVILLAVAGCTREAQPPPQDVDVTVVLKTDVTAEQRAAVERRLAGVPGMRDVVLETPEQAYEFFREQFKDDPDMLAQTTPESMPASFRATLADGAIAEAVEAAMLGTDGVSDAVIRGAKPLQGRLGIIVRVGSGLDAGLRDSIDKAIRAVPSAEAVTYESKAQAYDRLVKRSQGKGDLTGAIRPTDVHDSFRFSVATTSTLLELGAVRELDGVETMLFVPPSTL